MTLRQPFKDLLPDLSRDEREALAEEVRSDGVRDPVVVDELGNILDGHNRYALDPNARTVVKKGLTPAEKKAFVLRTNFARRNLSPEQTRELRATKKRIAAELRSEGRTQEETAKLLSVGRKTLDNWENATNGHSAISCIPDVRVKIHPNQHQVIAARLDKGETQESVAADYKVTRQAVAKIDAKIRREREKEQRMLDLAGEPEEVQRHEDFRRRLQDELESCQRMHAAIQRQEEKLAAWEEEHRVAMALETLLCRFRTVAEIAKGAGELRDFEDPERRISVQLEQLTQWWTNERND